MPMFTSGPYVLWVWSPAAHAWKQGRSYPDKFDAMDDVRAVLDRGGRAKVTYHGEQIFPTAGLRGSKHLHDVPRGGGKRRGKASAVKRSSSGLLRLQGGYGYQLMDGAAWGPSWRSNSSAWALARRAADERWEIVMLTPALTVAAAYLGSRRIGGDLCAVFLTTRGIFAQTEVAARGGKRRSTPQRRLRGAGGSASRSSIGMLVTDINKLTR